MQLLEGVRPTNSEVAGGTNAGSVEQGTKRLMALIPRMMSARELITDELNLALANDSLRNICSSIHKMCNVPQRRQRTVELKRLTLHHKHAFALMLELLALTLELLPHLEMFVPE